MPQQGHDDALTAALGDESANERVANEEAVSTQRDAAAAQASGGFTSAVHGQPRTVAETSEPAADMSLDVNVEDMSDKDLVVAFKSGNQDAYDEIYRRYEQRVRGICRRMLHNGPDADEATQEAFLRSYQALHRFNGRYQLGAWLSRIAANICVDQMRMKQRRPNEHPQEELFAEEPAQFQPDQIVADQLHVKETLSGIQPLHAEALLLRAVQGLSHEEMAGHLEMSPQQVKSLLHRARTSFRRVWQSASGFVVAPVAAFRGLGRKNANGMNDVAGLGGPAAAISLERIAAAGVAAMLAITGMTSSPAPVQQAQPKWPAESMPLPPQETDAVDTSENSGAGTTLAASAKTEASEDEGSILLPITQLVFPKAPKEPPPGPDDDDPELPLSPTAANDEIDKVRKQAEKKVDEASESLPELSDR